MISKSVPIVNSGNKSGMIFKYIKEGNGFIHTFCEGEMLYRLGFLPEEVVGKTLYDIYPAEFANSKIEFYQTTWDGKFTEYEISHEGINYIAFLRPVFEKNEVVEVIGTCIDNTNLKQMEEEIAQKEKLRKSILETMSEGLFIYEKGKVTTLNNTVEDILGMSTGPMDELTWKELGIELVNENHLVLNFAELPGVITQMDGIAINNAIYGVRNKRDLNIKWYSVNSKPIKLTSNLDQAALVSFTDITLQKEQELKLSDAYAYQYKLINHLDNGIVSIDSDGKIILINQRFLDLLDITEETCNYIGKSGSIFNHYFKEEIQDILKVVNETWGRATKELRTYNNKTLLCNFYPLIDNGNIVGGIWNFEDITYRKKMEYKIIKAKEEAEQANRAKSDFLSKISHELRTPLNGILGFAQLLEIDYPNLNDLQYDFVKEILKGGRHLLQLINEMLDLSKIETGAIKIDLQAVKLHTILDECIKIMLPAAKAKKVNIYRKFSDCDNVDILADPVRLKQVLLNLFDNAIKYNYENGEVEVSCQLENNEITIHIRDSGIGFSPTEGQKIFEPFYRVEGTTTEGSGIGLTLVKQFVHLMGGEIDVSSHVGSGSDFWFTLLLPSIPIGELPQSIPSQNFVNTNELLLKSKILYIEDNESNIKLVENIFKSKLSYNLMIAKTGEAGIEIARNEEVDLILLDIHLPDLHGLEVLKLIRAIDKTKNTPVIAISANAMPEDIKQALNAGFDRYLKKPINIKEMLEVVGDALNEK
ncbi:response regulator [Bacillus sp. BGMRC 2118]|nr:response regulator [Bacillus sp. BGMRC 2118]